MKFIDYQLDNNLENDLNGRNLSLFILFMQFLKVI